MWAGPPSAMSIVGAASSTCSVSRSFRRYVGKVWQALAVIALSLFPASMKVGAFSYSSMTQGDAGGVSAAGTARASWPAS